MEVQAGVTVVNDECAVRLTQQVEGGWLGKYISLGSGRATGTDCLVTDEQLDEAYRTVPWEWAPADDGFEERFVWTADWKALRQEFRPAKTT